MKQEYVKTDTLKKQNQFEDQKSFLDQFSDATPIWAQK